MLTTASWGALKSQAVITSLPSLVKGSGKQSIFFNQWRVRPSYGEYRGKEWSVFNENLKFKIRKHPCDEGIPFLTRALRNHFLLPKSSLSIFTYGQTWTTPNQLIMHVDAMLLKMARLHRCIIVLERELYGKKGHSAQLRDSSPA